MTESRKNEDRGLDVSAAMSHGDHAPLSARITFSKVRRFGSQRDMDGMDATIVLSCRVCARNSRATQFRASSNGDPNAFFTDKAVTRLMVQSLNNFRSKVPVSCAESLAGLIMGS